MFSDRGHVWREAMYLLLVTLPLHTEKTMHDVICTLRVGFFIPLLFIIHCCDALNVTAFSLGWILIEVVLLR